MKTYKELCYLLAQADLMINSLLLLKPEEDTEPIGGEMSVEDWIDQTRDPILDSYSKDKLVTLSSSELAVVHDVLVDWAIQTRRYVGTRKGDYRLLEECFVEAHEMDGKGAEVLRKKLGF